MPPANVFSAAVAF